MARIETQAPDNRGSEAGNSPDSGIGKAFGRGQYMPEAYRRTGQSGPAEPLLATDGLSRPERRQGRRIESGPDGRSAVVLSPEEREWLKRGEGKAAMCAGTWAVFGRATKAGNQPLEERMATPMMCGRRACQHCMETHRKKKRSRVEGPWKTFITITYSHRGVRVDEAWRAVHGWLSRLAAWMRKRFRGEGMPKMDYAWVLEPHKSGHPHVHLCSTLEWIDIPLWKRKWSEITCLPVEWLKVKRVWSSDGVCYYLAKYLEKAVMSNEVLALLGRRRLFASTLPALPEPDATWTRIGYMTEKRVWSEVENAEIWRLELGWRLKRKHEGALVTWVRDWSCPVLAALAVRYGESLWTNCLHRK